MNEHHSMIDSRLLTDFMNFANKLFDFTRGIISL